MDTLNQVLAQFNDIGGFLGQNLADRTGALVVLILLVALYFGQFQNSLGHRAGDLVYLAIFITVLAVLWSFVV